VSWVFARVGLVACVAVWCSGCLTANAGATRELHASASAAQLRVAQVEALLAESEQRLVQVEEALRAQGRSQADRLQNIEQVVDEMTRLRGEIEVLRFQVSELTRSVEAAQLAQERRQLHDESRLAQVEAYLGVTPPPPPTDAELGVTADGVGLAGSQVAVDVPPTAAEKLAVAKDHMTAGRHGVARAVLKRGIDEHTGAPEMAEMRYRFAETFFNERSWKSAANAFQRVTDNHASDDWACWSMLRIGECFEQLAQPSAAKLFFEGAAEGRCGRSGAAAEAKRKL
jgi:TolA-binding protein